MKLVELHRSSNVQYCSNETFQTNTWNKLYDYKYRGGI